MCRRLSEWEVRLAYLEGEKIPKHIITAQKACVSTGCLAQPFQLS